LITSHADFKGLVSTFRVTVTNDLYKNTPDNDSQSGSVWELL